MAATLGWCYTCASHGTNGPQPAASAAAALSGAAGLAAHLRATPVVCSAASIPGDAASPSGWEKAARLALGGYRWRRVLRLPARRLFTHLLQRQERPHQRGVLRLWRQDRHRGYRGRHLGAAHGGEAVKEVWR